MADGPHRTYLARGAEVPPIWGPKQMRLVLGRSSNPGGLHPTTRYTSKLSGVKTREALAFAFGTARALGSAKLRIPQIMPGPSVQLQAPLWRKLNAFSSA